MPLKFRTHPITNYNLYPSIDDVLAKQDYPQGIEEETDSQNILERLRLLVKSKAKKTPRRPNIDRPKPEIYGRGANLKSMNLPAIRDDQLYTAEPDATSQDSLINQAVLNAAGDDARMREFAEQQNNFTDEFGDDRTTMPGYKKILPSSSPLDTTPPYMRIPNNTLIPRIPRPSMEGIIGRADESARDNTLSPRIQRPSMEDIIERADESARADTGARDFYKKRYDREYGVSEDYGDGVSEDPTIYDFPNAPDVDMAPFYGVHKDTTSDPGAEFGSFSDELPDFGDTEAGIQELLPDLFQETPEGNFYDRDSHILERLRPDSNLINDAMIQRSFGDIEKSYGLSSGLLESIQQVETGGATKENLRAAEKSEGAIGSFQQRSIFQEDIARLDPTMRGYNPKDPKQAAKAAAIYIKHQMDTGLSERQAIEAYNAGRTGQKKGYGKNYGNKVMGLLGMVEGKTV